MTKNIVFCADGTWNNPNEDENQDHSADPTNVYKLFLRLAGDLDMDSLRAADEQEKSLSDGADVQVAKYIHGVGDSRNPIVKLMGGAFGAGVISRVVRGYTFISRNYTPGADIFIVGFSRGAYTARALAGLIASQGLLAPPLTVDKELAYRRGAEAWYRYRRASGSTSILAHLAEIAADLPAFLSQGSLAAGDLLPVDHIAAIAVWDTVGAMGLPEYAGDGDRVDAFRFADTTLSARVRQGFHAVALDEQREDFVPTLWTPAGNVTQVLFPGAHGDVGGGYPMRDNESGLSDGALEWMIDRLRGAGVRFDEATCYASNPDPAGVAHQPWAHEPWTLPGIRKDSRDFAGASVAIDPSVAARIAAGPVVGEPGSDPAPYRPGNLPT
jgi:uncharacterized protein (DUF2235 family)